MSGRLAQFTPPVAVMPEGWRPAWNIAPGKPLLILRKTAGNLECASVLWNLTPTWLKQLDRAAFSAKAEFLHEKPMFGQALAQRRCLIPVDGFFVWQVQGKRKQPWYLRSQKGGLTLAGLWERYSLDDGSYWDSCALITVPAKGLPARLGERMPVTLNSGEQAIWLANATATSHLQPLLLNASSLVGMMHPVNPAMSSPGTQGAQCCTPSGRVITEV
ncbi:SOS response-associated peptidase [Halopseudomonas laoshanensis]|uniref:Abasic site processing protein n=1 Tax=Halopseudomonas laoshanensis TaxID=2268758 RepID=A0A7V7GTQ1_9GAMM|nr:SOS response-associated peptidase [Halopseudomonas laoshanensis]KAA0694765.1 SOS response-associated peptidase [Halopseudomonas laoshanensis]